MNQKGNYILRNLTFPPSFFQDEVREGYYVPNMMKRYWAAQLVVLSEIARICDKYDIPWYLDNGSLLGAVRHGGFVPWDDDTDISMLRQDYERFFEVAKSELPEGYCVLDIRLEEEYEDVIGRIVNSHAIDYSDSHMQEFYGCPYTVGVDIFPLDDLAGDEEKEEERRRQAGEVAQAIGLLDEGKTDSPECRKLLANIERENHITLRRRGNLKRQLLLLTQKLYTKYSSEQAEYVALMPYWIEKQNHKYPKALFQNRVSLLFENICMPVPARYDEVLRIEYGNYMELRKGGWIHDYPVYGEQEEMLRAHIGRNPFRYTYQKGTIEELQKRMPLHEKCQEMLAVLSRAHGQIKVLAEAGDMDSAGRLLEGCQSIAISMGTSLEKKSGDPTSVIRQLEEYCELLFQCHEGWQPDSAERLEQTLRNIEMALNLFWTERRKDVLFLPCRSEWWPSMEGFWRQQSADANTDVYVMSVPCCGHCDEVPEYVSTIDTGAYDLERHTPDTIVIQFPYDGWNDSMKIPEQYYASNLLQYTDQLVYIPCFITDDPVTEKDNLVKMLKVLIEQPAVVYADQVMVPSEKQRELYIRTMTECAGPGSEAYWVRKIVVTTHTDDAEHTAKDNRQRAREMLWNTLKNRASSELLDAGQEKMGEGQQTSPDVIPRIGPIENSVKKLLVYRVGISSLLQYGEKGILQLEESFGAITEQRDYILCIFSPGCEMKELESICPQLWKQYEIITNRFIESGIGIYDAEGISDDYPESFDAYYGDAGNLAHRCRNLGIPVMIRKGF